MLLRYTPLATKIAVLDVATDTAWLIDANALGRLNPSFESEPPDASTNSTVAYPTPSGGSAGGDGGVAGGAGGVGGSGGGDGCGQQPPASYPLPFSKHERAHHRFATHTVTAALMVEIVK